VDEQARARLDAPDDHRADHHRHHRISGYAQGHGGGERAAQSGAGGGVGGGDALDIALAETVPGLGGGLGPVPAEQAGNVAPRARDDADDEPDETGNAGGLGDALIFVPVRPPAPERRDRTDLEGAVGQQLVEQFGNAEQADDDGDEVEPAVQFADAEGEARVAGDRIAADGGDEQADDAGKQALGDGFRR